MSIKIDYEAVGKILQEDMRGPIDDLGERIAANVDTGRVDALVDAKPVTTDRAISVVAIKHPAGMAIEAKHGALRRAAAAAGHEVTSRKAAT
jgi:hypothetical protein